MLLTKSMLQSSCLSTEAINLTIDLLIAKHLIEMSTLDMRDLNGFNCLIDQLNACGIGYPDFAMHRQKN